MPLLGRLVYGWGAAIFIAGKFQEGAGSLPKRRHRTAYADAASLLIVNFLPLPRMT
jgi:hypothetical protein